MSTSEQSRNLVICYDGTGGEFYHNTNPKVIHEMTHGYENQMTFYDPGVATGSYEYHKDAIGRIKDFESGKGTMQNVEDGYRFLMRNYEDGDKVFIFGFSRGAFTARSLAGMLNEIGLLPPHQENLVEHAVRLYNEDSLIYQFYRADFSAEFCGGQGLPVEFVGAWDTVGALSGDPAERRHVIDNLTNVKKMVHLVAIDEFRPDFKPNLLKNPQPNHQEIWFPGAHSDVGGQYADDRGLSNAALLFMVNRATRSGLRISDYAAMQNEGKYQANPLGKIHDSYLGWEFRGEAVLREIPDQAWIIGSVIFRIASPDHVYDPENVREGAYRVVGS